MNFYRCWGFLLKLYVYFLLPPCAAAKLGSPTAGVLRIKEDLENFQKFNLFKVKISKTKDQPLDNFDVYLES